MVETVTVEKLMTKSGHETLKVNDYFVHSSYNPIREAEQLAKKYYKPHHAHIVFGYGCGYFIDALLKEFHFNERLLIVDPLFDDKIISIRKEHEHLNLFTSKAIENFEFFLNELAAEARVSFQVICLSNYDKVFTEIYKNLLIKV